MNGLSKTVQQKTEKLLLWLQQAGRVGVAFSAGVDSTVVAKAAQLACGDQAVAFTAYSMSLAEGELDEAKELADLIGISHVVVNTEEFQNPDYVKNAPNRCYFCKNELYTQLETLRTKWKIDLFCNGANLDDRGDHRPGMQAAQQHEVASPLLDIGFTKADVRELARHWELPVAEKPATPCLSSRIAYGLEVTPDRVKRVDQAERYLKELLGIQELRVRHEPNDLARIEIPLTALPSLLEEQTRSSINEKFHEIGFRFVTLDLEGFRSGSFNSFLASDQLQILD